MASDKSGPFETAANDVTDLASTISDSIYRQAAVSTAPVSVFRGRLCDLIIPNRKLTTFHKQIP